MTHYISIKHKYKNEDCRGKLQQKWKQSRLRPNVMAKAEMKKS